MKKNKKSKILGELIKSKGLKADVQLVSALVNIAAAVKKSAELHPVGSRDLLNIFGQYEDTLKDCMISSSMEDPTNVTKVLVGAENLEDVQHPEIVVKALAFLHGPLKVCIDNELTKILATPQVITHVDNVFRASLKFRSPDPIREVNDLFQLRSGCSTYRFNPFIMFSFESLMKMVFLLLVSVVSISRSQIQGCNDLSSQFYILRSASQNRASWDIAVVIMCVTSFFYEIGEILNRCRTSLSGHPLNAASTLFASATSHFSDKWNIIDIITISMVMFWIYYQFLNSGEGSTQLAQGYLSASTITLSLGILRFQSMWKQTGQLIIMVFEMMKDLLSFFIVALTAFYSLFPNLHGKNFSTITKTFLTLLDAALGSHDFSVFEGTGYDFIGTGLMVVYIVLVTIILLNLVIARMSATHQKIDDTSLEVWSKLQGANVEEFVLIFERNPLCMLPPPFNLISIAAALLSNLFLSSPQSTGKPTHDEAVISVAGSTSDKVIR
jgi:hypothetical protein